MTLARWCSLFVLVLGLFALSRGDDQPARSTAPVAVVSDLVGAGTCSATACHGSIAPWDRSLSPVLRNEHTTWMSDDPHSLAYQVLFDPRSEHIAGALAANPALVQPAYRDARCLACHATPRPAAALATTAWLNPDGVGCESCHGAARRWLGPHTTSDWSAMTKTAKSNLGMRDTEDLHARARLCVGCHVGAAESDQSPLRDVNHDLIAAGHPRLNFELAAYLDNIPAHWIEKNANANPPGRRNPERAADFAARAWSIGRLTTLEAALDLLQSRSAAVEQAAKSKTHAPAAAPWPEFSEYDCFSCHHDLNGQTRRASRVAPETAAGAPRWGSWNLSTTDELLAEIAKASDSGRFHETKGRLAAEMTKPFPDATAVKRLSREVVLALGPPENALKSQRFDGDGVAQLIGRLDQGGAWDGDASWDEAAQRYLALVPLWQSWVELEPGRKGDQDRLEARLKILRGLLRFPKGFDSPKGLRIDSIRLQTTPIR